MAKFLSSSRVRQALSPNDYNYFVEYMKQFGGKKSTLPNLDSIFNKYILAPFRTSALGGLRVGVFAKQAPSVALVFPNHSARAVTEGMGKLAIMSNKELAEMSPVMADRLTGKVNIETAELSQMKDSPLKKAQQVLMKNVAMGDNIAMKGIGAISKAEMILKYPELKGKPITEWDFAKREELRKMVEEDVNDAQPPSIMSAMGGTTREKSIFTRSLTMFTSATMKVYGKTVESGYYFRQGEYEKGFKTLSSVLAQTISIALINLGLAKWRGKDVDAKTIFFSTALGQFYLAGQLFDAFILGYGRKIIDDRGINNIIRNTRSSVINLTQFVTAENEEDKEVSRKKLVKSLVGLGEAGLFLTGLGSIPASIKELEYLFQNTWKQGYYDYKLKIDSDDRQFWYDEYIKAYKSKDKETMILAENYAGKAGIPQSDFARTVNNRINKIESGR